MSEKLETAAEALYLEGCRRAIAVGMMKDPPVPFADLAESSRRDYRLSAAAVIRSIREPSEEMIHVGSYATGSSFRVSRPTVQVWTTMIDKLLEG